MEKDFKSTQAYGALIASKRWLNKTELALYLGCSEASIDGMREHMKETRFTSGRPLFDRIEIDAMLESKKV